MLYLDLIEIVRGKYKEKADTEGRYVSASVDDILQFKDMLQIDRVYADGFKKTESAAEFYEAYELFDKTFDKRLQESLFYGAKLGFFFEGVPNRLTFLLKKAASTSATPSITLQSVSPLAWGRFLKKGTLPDDICIKDVLDAIYGTETQLVDILQLRVRHREFSEVYVGNVDRICLLPNDIADTLSIEDLQDVRYVPKVGVCVNNEPLRTFDGYKGITMDEFDLRYME